MMFYSCNICGIVTRDPNGLAYRAPCPTCTTPRVGGKLFFDMSVLILIKDMAEAFRFIDNSPIKDHHLEPEDFRDVAVVIFFCILKEVLLERFLSTLMTILKLPDNIIFRLNKDNDSHFRRLNQLFPSLTQSKWSEAIERFPSDKSNAFVDLDNLLVRATDARNNFIHEALHGAITPQLAEDCFNAVPTLLDCHMHLNNTFIHPILHHEVMQTK